MSKCVQGCKCGRHSRRPETRQKISESLRGHVKTESHRLALALAQTGKVMTDSPAYSTAHYRVISQRGKATDHSCVDCGQPANEWSYIEPSGYSDSPDDYSPRCWLCHRRFDFSKERSCESRR